MQLKLEMKPQGQFVCNRCKKGGNDIPGHLMSQLIVANEVYTTLQEVVK